MGKRGRPTLYVRDRDGVEVHGLSALTIKEHGQEVAYRLYATATNPRKWFGTYRPVEREAGNGRHIIADPAGILAFRRWQSGQRREMVTITDIREPTTEEWGDVQAFLDADPSSEAVPPSWWAKGMLRTLEGAPKHQIVEHYPAPLRAVWQWVGQQIRRCPRQCAQLSDVEELGYLHTLEKPKPAISLKAAGKLYFDAKRPTCDKKGMDNLETWWDEFVSVCAGLNPAVTTVDKLDFDVFQAYATKVLRDEKHPTKGKPRSTSYRRGRFGAVSTILNYAARCRKLDAHLIARLRNDWAVPLETPPQRSGKKYPFSPSDFHAMLTKATDEQRAMLLLGVNMAAYPVDLLRITWDHADLQARHLVFRRDKKDAHGSEGTVRVAVLWRDTVEALRKIKGESKRIFSFTDAKTPNDWVRALRKAAKVTAPYRAEDMRNTAATVAARNVPGMQYRALMGHKFNDEDAGYVEANPEFVADACKAIAAYLGVE